MANTPPNTTTLTIGIIVVLVVLAGGIAAFKNSPTTPTDAATIIATSSPATTTATSTPAPVTTTATATAVPASGSIYNDGTYSTTITYATPENNETVGFSLTIKNDVITAASGTNSSRSRESKEYVADFLSALPKEVVGKKISEVSVSRLAGASLTSRAFTQALVKLEAQAS